VTAVSAEVESLGAAGWRVEEAVIWRTARRLMEGAVLLADDAKPA
jgi:2-methylaconitate cis-trans-isomerase PrpF